MILTLILRQLKFRLKYDAGRLFFLCFNLTYTLSDENTVLKFQMITGKAANYEETDGKGTALE